MQTDPTPTPRARLRARVAACGRCERGDTLIEVMIAAVLVALIAAASLIGYGGVGHVAATQRHEEQAAALAQQDQSRLRGLDITQLSGLAGNRPSPLVTIDGTVYAVVSSSQFISGGGGAASCNTGPSTSADQVQTTSTVSWGKNNDGRLPVIIHGLITPAQGGSLIVSAVDQNGPLAGVLATLSGGPTTVSPLLTNSNGCAVFGGLAGGDYTVAFSDPGYLDVNGRPPANATVTVVPTQTATVPQIQIALPGAISATFSSAYNGSLHLGATMDQLSVFNTAMTPSTTRVYGTNSTYTTPLPTPLNLFPWIVNSSGGMYSYYAGGCTGDNPPVAAPPQPQSAYVLSGTNSPVIQLPAMIVRVWANAPNTYDDTNAAVALNGTWARVSNQPADYNSTETTSSTGTSFVSVTRTGTSFQWIGTFGPNHGIAKVYIDGVLNATIDTWSAATQYQHLAYNVAGLTNASHTLKILVTGTQNVSATGTLISIDAINVPTAAALENINPNVTLTDNNTGCGNTVDHPLTQIPTLTAVGALLSPGQPYGNFTVCADDGVNHNTAAVANVSYLVAGNPVDIYLGSGSPGLAGGKCP